jgi:hypothetical protein
MNGRLEGNHKRARGPGKTKSKLALRKSLFLPRPAQKEKPSSKLTIWYACADSLARMPLD